MIFIRRGEQPDADMNIIHNKADILKKNEYLSVTY